MSTALVMPQLGENTSEATVSRWLKVVGDRVEADEPIVEISTDKVDTEVVAPVSGTLISILVPEDGTAAVGVELALIGESSDAAAQPVQEAAAVFATGHASPPPPTATAPEPDDYSEARTVQPVDAAPLINNDSGSSQRAARSDARSADYTPLVRKLARDLQVDLSVLVGSGAGGRIRKDDVLSAAARPNQRTATPPPQASPASTAGAGSTGAKDITPHETSLRERAEPMSRLRRVIASRMVESLQTSAQLTTVVEVDVTKVGTLRQQMKGQFRERHGIALTFLPFLAVAAIDALKKNPVINTSLDPAVSTVTYHSEVHLGIAVDTERGLLVPVISDAGDLNVSGLARQIANVADRTRAGRIGPDELSGGTFTITNTGSRGALFDTPIINQPQSAILATGVVTRRPVALQAGDGTEHIGIRSMVYLALSYDHRIIDGADAARFLGTMKSTLEAGFFEV